MPQLMPQLEFEFYYSQVFWLCVVFGALIIASYGIIYKKLSSILQLRADTVSQALDIASKNSQIINELEAQLHRQIDEIANAKDKIKQESISQFNKYCTDANATMQHEIQKMYDDLYNSIPLTNSNNEIQDHKKKTIIDVTTFLINKIIPHKVNIGFLNHCYQSINSDAADK